MYQFFGSLLGCSQQGMPGFDAYTAASSMYKVHKFMDLNPYEVGYFIQQVGMAAASLGVADDDVKAVGMALNSLFGYRCAPPATAIKAQGPQLQSICTNGACPVSPMANGTCDTAYEPVMVPMNTTSNSTKAAPGSQGTATMSSSGSGMMPTMSGMPSTVPTGGAAAYGISFAAAAAGVAAFIL